MVCYVYMYVFMYVWMVCMYGMYVCMYVCMSVYALSRSGCMKLLVGCPGGAKTYLEPDHRLIRAQIEGK